MENNVIALTVSIISLFLAALSLGWNIYRDIVLKPRVKISFGVRTLVHPSIEGRPEYLVISATNFGPGNINLSMIQMKYSGFWLWLFRKSQYAVIIHDYKNPLSAQLPNNVKVGNKIDLLLPYNQECFLSAPCTHIGLSDYYGRIHWAPKKDIKQAKKKYKKDFNNKNS
ncbi:MAG: hypothetical protein V1933_08140 [Candidatus Omnitrophota bacterium]